MKKEDLEEVLAALKVLKREKDFIRKNFPPTLADRIAPMLSKLDQAIQEVEDAIEEEE